MSRLFVDSDLLTKEKKHLALHTVISFWMTRPYKFVTATKKIQNNHLNLVSIKCSIPSLPNNKFTHTRQHRSSTVSLKVSMALFLPMVKLPQEKRIQWKEKLEKCLPKIQELFPEWSNMFLIQLPKHMKTLSSESKYLWLNCIWKNWKICLILTKTILKLGQIKNEVYLLKISLKNIYRRLNKYTDWSK